VNHRLHVHEHDDHFHAHEHYHGGKENIWISTIGMVIHSMADGAALGATFFRKFANNLPNLISKWTRGEREYSTWNHHIHSNPPAQGTCCYWLWNIFAS
jgi:hypothetical protein